MLLSRSPGERGHAAGGWERSVFGILTVERTSLRFFESEKRSGEDF